MGEYVTNPANVREEILITAADCVCSTRQDQYGNPENNFATCANLWNDYLSAKHGDRPPITDEDVAIMLGLLKVARMATGKTKRDNYVDACGYFACAAECAENSEKAPRTYEDADVPKPVSEKYA